MEGDQIFVVPLKNDNDKCSWALFILDLIRIIFDYILLIALNCWFCKFVAYIYVEKGWCVLYSWQQVKQTKVKGNIKEFIEELIELAFILKQVNASIIEILADLLLAVLPYVNCNQEVHKGRNKSPTLILKCLNIKDADVDQSGEVPIFS